LQELEHEGEAGEALLEGVDGYIFPAGGVENGEDGGEDSVKVEVEIGTQVPGQLHPKVQEGVQSEALVHRDMVSPQGHKLALVVYQQLKAAGEALDVPQKGFEVARAVEFPPLGYAFVEKSGGGVLSAAGEGRGTGRAAKGQGLNAAESSRYRVRESVVSE
jgi:hypothetical protein